MNGKNTRKPPVIGETPGNQSVTIPVDMSESMARQALAHAEKSLLGAIAGYELAARAMMAVDFNRGLTIATWAKALRVKSIEMKLEGA